MKNWIGSLVFARAWGERPCVAILCLVASLASCSGREFARGDSKIKYDPFQPDPVAAPNGFPSYSCLDSIASVGSIRELDGLAPEGMRNGLHPQDIGWSPTSLADLAVGQHGYAVADRGGAEVALVAPDLSRHRVWGRKGMGPGELQSPIAVSYDDDAGTIWVLDERRRAIIGFDTVGNFLRELNAPNMAVDLAIDPDGGFLVTHRVLMEASGESVTIASHVDDDGHTTPALVYPRASLKPPRFALPGLISPRVKVIGARVVIFYPPSGTIDVYARSPGPLQHLMTVQSCVPPSLAIAYHRQAEARARTQSWISLVSDVDIRGDMLLAIGPRPDREGRYGVQRFSLTTGRSLGAMAYPAGPIQLPNEVRLTRDPTTFVVMDTPRGVLARMKVSPGISR